MVMDLPIVAYRCTAVGDTLGNAGLQFPEKDIASMAEAAWQLARDPGARASVLRGQRERRRAFEPAAVEAALRRHLEAL
jgi:glycosyltransferase involved in cell wall biosynthesis